MSQSRNLPATAIDSVLAFLLPLILPTLNDDHTAARDLALTMLAEYHPASVRELRLAAEAIGFSPQSLALLAQSAAPDSPPYQREADAKSACTLNRSSHQSQRRLTEIQRDARMASPSEPLTTAPRPASTVPIPTRAIPTGPVARHPALDRGGRRGPAHRRHQTAEPDAGPRAKPAAA